MQIVKLKHFNTNSALTSIKRDASCSRGWLRLIVQTIFFSITVVSFIMILLISINPKIFSPDPIPNCAINYCHVECFETPYYDDRLQYIYSSLQVADRTCAQLALTLINPYFVNGILPTRWMGDTNVNIGRLHIQGGNLHYITPGAFETSLGDTLETLQFSKISFSSLEENAFIGLNNLLQISITDCSLVKVQSKILKSVSSTIKYLTIAESGEWSPDNFTGTTVLPKLNNAFLVGNNFGEIKKHSFSGLRNVESLCLTRCNITAIQQGTFDYMDHLKHLDLSHNLLVTIPTSLFDRIIYLGDPHTKINLGYNLWFCDCETTKFSLLSLKGFLGDDPTCDGPVKYQNMTLVNYENDICVQCYENETTLYKNEKTIPDIIKKSPLTRDSNHGFECKYRNIVRSSLLNLSEINQKGNRFANDNWIYPQIYVDSSNKTILDMEVAMDNTYGLIWYKDTCPKKIYCLDVALKKLRISHIKSTSWIVFCRWNLETGLLDQSNCVPINVSDILKSSSCDRFSSFRIIKHALFYFSILISGLITGGCAVYCVLWRNPTLLKGSKRLLIVKHKEVDALVLPPKVPLRVTKSNIPFPDIDQKVFILPSNDSPLKRCRSVRSETSSTPSYVSALQPSDDQLEQWRSQQHLEPESIYASITSHSSHFSAIIRRDSVTYFVLEDDHTHSDKL